MLLRRSTLALRRMSTQAAAPAALSHDELRTTVQYFVEREINPHVDKWEAEGIFPAKELFKKMGDAGLLGLTKPIENGGMGLDYSYNLVLAEELGAVSCGGVPMAIGVQTDMATPALAKFGSPELREQFLTPTVAGDYVACLGVSEVGAGSDVAGLITTARSDGDDYIVNGGKMWTTNGTQADWCCLLVNTDDEGGARPPHGNKTMLCMPMDLPGISAAPRFDKLGMRSSDTTQLTLEDVRIPKKYVIGQPNKGFVYQMVQFQEERLWAAANALKGLQRCIDDTLDYTQTRTAFGKPLIANQVVRFRLAELQTELELLRALTWKAADKVVEGEDVTLLASMAKLKTGRLAREITDACLQYWGGKRRFLRPPFLPGLLLTHSAMSGPTHNHNAHASSCLIVPHRASSCLLVRPLLACRYGLHERDAHLACLARHEDRLHRGRRRRGYARDHLQGRWLPPEGAQVASKLSSDCLGRTMTEARGRAISAAAD